MLALTGWFACIRNALVAMRVSVLSCRLDMCSCACHITVVSGLQLGASFPVKLEAPHVVDSHKQVWAGAIGKGPDGATLQATYKQANTNAFQDSIGRSAVEICKVVPDGVLLFLPSYGMLDKLMARWKVGTKPDVTVYHTAALLPPTPSPLPAHCLAISQYFLCM